MKAKKKLENSKTKLKQNLELAIGIEIESLDNDSCKKDAKDYELLQGMMEELKFKGIKFLRRKGADLDIISIYHRKNYVRIWCY